MGHIRLRSRLCEPTGRRLKLLVALLLLFLVLTHRQTQTPPSHRISIPSPVTEIAKAISSNKNLAYADLSNPHLARALCQQHGWDVFDENLNNNINNEKKKKKKRKIYDLFTINTELDWLEIRLNTTYDFVDYFVIIEGELTFTGHEKPLYLRDNWDKFAAYHDKIIYHQLEYPPDFQPKLTWDFESLQRNALFTQVFPRLLEKEEGPETGVAVLPPQAPNQGDVLIVADIDEIVRPETLLVLRTCAFPRRLTLRSRFYYYSFEYLHRGTEWPHPQATYYAGGVPVDGKTGTTGTTGTTGMGTTILPDDLRNSDGLREWGYAAPLMRWFEKGDLWNAGWHCSSCFATVDELLTKLESFSHMLLNAPEYRDRDRIVDRVRRGKDLWDRNGEFYDRIENNNDIPAPLKADRERWRYLVDRQGESAGFTDYP